MATFQHEAMLYDGLEGFLAGTVPFVRAGVEGGEPVLVAVGAEKIGSLRAALPGDADVRYADMAEMGRNPGRIIPAWHEFLAAHGDGGRPVRGIGEPIWAERSADELVECQLHEALLNVAFADAHGFRLLCPYDVGALDERVVHEAHCSHPIVVAGEEAHESHAYRGVEDPLAPFAAPLPRPPGPAESVAFERQTLGELRALVADRGQEAGLDRVRAQDLVLAVNELATNSVRHGGGHGVLRTWRDKGSVLFEVRDSGQIDDPLVGRRLRQADQIGGWGVWIAHQVADLVQVRSGPDGTVVRVQMRCV
jgi:anti-sigma regulatory factor (Ser/Thr protein kinase)